VKRVTCNSKPHPNPHRQGTRLPGAVFQVRHPHLVADVGGVGAVGEVAQPGVDLHPLSEAAVAPQVDQAVAAVLLAVEFISVVAAQVFPFQFQAPGVVGGAVGQGGVAQVAGRPGQVVAGEVAGGGAADVAEVPVVLAAVAEGQGGGPALGPAGVQAQFDTPVAGFPGVAWTVASFLVVPVLVSRNIGPIDAVKESALLLKKTWGENLIGQGGVGLVFGLGMFALIVVGVAAIVGAAMTGSMVFTGVVVALLIALLVLAGLVQAALTGIYSAALYRYASGEGDTEGFDEGLLEQAFAVKNK